MRKSVPATVSPAEAGDGDLARRRLEVRSAARRRRLGHRRAEEEQIGQPISWPAVGVLSSRRALYRAGGSAAGRGGLDSTEGSLDPLAGALAGFIATMARRSVVTDERVLCDVLAAPSATALIPCRRSRRRRALDG
jgi:hypothetical protein